MSPKEIFSTLFHNDPNRISLSRLEDLSTMFRNPNRINESISYLFEINRVGRKKDSSDLDYLVDVLVTQHPLDTTRSIQYLENA